MTREAKPPVVVFKRKRMSEQRQTCPNPICTWTGASPEIAASGVDRTCPRCGRHLMTENPELVM